MKKNLIKLIPFLIIIVSLNLLSCGAKKQPSPVQCNDRNTKDKIVDVTFAGSSKNRFKVMNNFCCYDIIRLPVQEKGELKIKFKSEAGDVRYMLLNSDSPLTSFDSFQKPYNKLNLKNLEKENIPDIIKKLKRVNKPYPSRERYLNDIKNTIGNKNYLLYEPLILKHTDDSNELKYEGESFFHIVNVKHHDNKGICQPKEENKMAYTIEGTLLCNIEDKTPVPLKDRLTSTASSFGFVEEKSICEANVWLINIKEKGILSLDIASESSLKFGFGKKSNVKYDKKSSNLKTDKKDILSLFAHNFPIQKDVEKGKYYIKVVNDMKDRAKVKYEIWVRFEPSS